MSNFKLKFKLKQHTPIIHFQHDQHGATLRATELKPKLDRFILKKLGNGNYEQGAEIAKNNGWLIGDDIEKPALDYKVKIETKNVIPIKIIKRKKDLEENEIYKLPFFFGNMGKDYENGSLGLVYNEKEIKGIITSFKTNLIKKINELLPVFFATHNFGTRQSKGYGSFSITSINDKNINYDFKEDYKYFFQLQLNTQNKSIELNNIIKKMEDVEWFYKSLRGGINLYGRNGTDNLYFKSALFMFLNSKGIQWDKKTIKKAFLNKNNETIYEAKYNKNYEKFEKKQFHIQYVDTQAKNHNNPDILTNFQYQNDLLDLKLWKDLLGLASTETWLSYRANISKDEAYYNDREKKYKKIKKEEREIDRLKSPIQFKPILVKKKNNLYLDVYFDVLVNDFVEALEKVMIITIIQQYKEFVSEQKDKKTVIQTDELVLSFPSLNSYKNKLEFIREFLDYSIQNIIPKNHIKKTTTNNYLFNQLEDTLNNIYSQLKNN